MTFKEKLSAIQIEKHSIVCVGLDPDIERIPAGFFRNLEDIDRLLAFNASIIEATAPYASAYKLNAAFYECYGSSGWALLEKTLRLLPDDVVSIVDSKRGDIGNSARMYARSVFETLDVDACTVAPYMGLDSIEPFLAYANKAAFILARTSNTGAEDLQERRIDDVPVYEHLVRLLAEKANRYAGQMGLVVGATAGEALGVIREVAPGVPLLIPGVGAQGGDPAAVMRDAYAGPGTVLVNSSRSILYAGSGSDFDHAAAEEAQHLQEQLQAA